MVAPRFKDQGTKTPPKGIITDEFGVPLLNLDQKRTDIHGRELQPESDPHMAYQPRAGLTEDEEDRARALLAIAKGRGLPFLQRQVDEVRFRVTMNLARSCIHGGWEMPQPTRHLWFPTAGDIGDYCLREGNAPSDTDRPKHLQRLNLAIDISHIPEHIRRFLAPGGSLEMAVREAVEKAGLEGTVAHAALMQEVIASMASEHQLAGIEYG